MNALSATWTSIAPALGNHLWQSTLFAAIAALLALTLRNYQARTRYWLWLAASAKFLIPFSLLLSIGSHLAWSVHPVASQPAMYATIDQLSQPFTETTLPVTLTLPIPAHPSTLLPAVLATIWLCGFLAVLAFWSIQLRRVSRAVRAAKPLQSGRELEILRRLEQTAKLPRQIELLSSPHSMEPGVVGILRPILLWPEGISQHLNDAHLEAILAHEVCHVQRHDNLTSGIHMLVESLFWFHPLVWWLEKRLVDERERACDEVVLQQGKQPQIYAESILKVCELCIESPLTCVSGITGADLKKRIVQIMTHRIVRKLDLSKKLLLGTVGLMAVCVPIVFGQIIATQNMALPAPIPAAFDVVSIKPANPDEPKIFDGVMPTPNGANASGTLQVLIRSAYGFMNFPAEDRVSGVPNWAKTERFDIQAKMTDADIALMQKLSQDQEQEQRELMLQALLADRFKLRVHRETKQLPVYELVVAKNGSKLNEAKPDEANPDGWKGKDGKLVAGSYLRYLGRGHVVAQLFPIANLANVLNQPDIGLGRPVVDKTGLTSKYNFDLSWQPNENQASDDSRPSIFTALQEQLGLRLQPATGPVEILVIDHVEPPSEN